MRSVLPAFICSGCGCGIIAECFLNLDGIICFRSIASFAVMGLVFLYLLEPAAENRVKKLSGKTVQSVCLVLLLVFAADCVLSFMLRTPITY